MERVAGARARATACGEIESDRFSRRANLLEAAVLFGLLQIALWGLIAREPEPGAAREIAGPLLLGGCLVYCALLGPWLHGDRAASLGLPSPRANLAAAARALRGSARERRAALWLVAILAVLTLRGWPNLLARLGLRRHAPELFAALCSGSAGALLPLLAALPLAFALGVFALRWETLRGAARALAPAAAALGTALALGALWLRQSDAGAAGQGIAFGLRAERASEIFYLLWALLQQQLALGYFNARLRRGIAPAAGGSARSQALVALLNALGFGLLHLPSPLLCAATAVFESCLAWHFQRAKTRNLLASAALHALLGALFAQWLPISMDVGPWPGKGP